MIIRTVVIHVWIFYFHSLCSSCDVVCFTICWSASVTYVNLTSRICRMDVNASDYSLWSGMMSFYALMIFGVADVVYHGRIDDYNSCMWNVSIVSYLWGSGNYPCVVTWNSLCMNHVNLTCSVCENVTVTWNGFPCPCLHNGVWSLAWYGGFCMVWIGDALLEFPKEVSYVDNPLQCDHTHHIQNT